MKSLRELYRIGRGPSSSHTMGPEHAALKFEGMYPNAAAFKVILYGSLARTGIGHGTDVVLKKTFTKPVKVIFDTETVVSHPNTMDIFAMSGGKKIGKSRVLSTGGGAVSFEGDTADTAPDVYKFNTFEEIENYCNDNEITLWQYVEECEGEDIWEFLDEVWHQMVKTVKAGLKDSGKLPGGLNIEKKAKLLLHQRHINEQPETKENRMVCAYAFAVGEQNASGETVVTAPTCGSCGVMPSVLYYMQKKHKCPDEKILHALATGGLFGNLIKTNASISGAECGCQAEVGSACSMAAAALGELFELRIDQIEYAAEVAMEHHLGLTCDPVKGLVQIPCIERNAVAAMRAINSVNLANFLSGTRMISFDVVVETMFETGRDLKCIYKETSEGGLAKLYKNTKKTADRY